jgi:hypothetical protein
VAQASEIIGYYERRWLIEDYHKVWKSAGTRVEALRMQSRDNLTRMYVILAFIAAAAAVGIYQRGTIRTGKKLRSAAGREELDAAVVEDGEEAPAG